MVTSIRQDEFLSVYRTTLRAYIERYKKLDDPPDPIQLFFTRNFDYERMEEMGPEWESDVQEIKRLNSLWRDAFIWINEANKQAQSEMTEHFKTAGYDYEHIPTVLAIDHVTPKILKDYQQKLTRGEVKIHKTAIQVGQLVIVSDSWQGIKTYTIIVEATGLSFPFTLSCEGNREQKVAYHEQVLRLASLWSRMTDWSGFVERSAKIRRTLGEQAKTVYQEWLEGIG